MVWQFRCRSRHPSGVPFTARLHGPVGFYAEKPVGSRARPSKGAFVHAPIGLFSALVAMSTGTSKHDSCGASTSTWSVGTGLLEGRVMSVLDTKVYV